MADPVFRSVTPLIPAGTSLSRALAFYKDQLGFSVLWEDENMAGIRRGSVSFNLVANTNKEWADNSSCSIGVSDLEALYEEYRSRGVFVGPVKLYPWGRREFHMIVPSGVCLQFYEQVD